MSEKDQKNKPKSTTKYVWAHLDDDDRLLHDVRHPQLHELQQRLHAPLRRGLEADRHLPDAPDALAHKVHIHLLHTKLNNVAVDSCPHPRPALPWVSSRGWRGPCVCFFLMLGGSTRRDTDGCSPSQAAATEWGQRPGGCRRPLTQCKHGMRALHSTSLSPSNSPSPDISQIRVASLRRGHDRVYSPTPTCGIFNLVRELQFMFRDSKSLCTTSQ